MPLFQIVHMTFINCNNIEVFRDNPFEMQNSQAQKSGCTKVAFKFRYLSPSIRKFLFLIAFFADFFCLSLTNINFYKSKVDFHGLSKEIPNNIKKLRFVRFLPIFSICIFSAQMQTSGKVFMWLNSNYECQ